MFRSRSTLSARALFTTHFTTLTTVHPRAAAAPPHSKSMPAHLLVEPDQHALLDVQAILGLVEDDGLRTVDHLTGDLLAAMCREAVHDHRVALGLAESGGIDLVRLEVGLPFGCLRL